MVFPMVFPSRLRPVIEIARFTPPAGIGAYAHKAEPSFRVLTPCALLGQTARRRRLSHEPFDGVALLGAGWFDLITISQTMAITAMTSIARPMTENHSGRLNKDVRIPSIACLSRVLGAPPH